MVSAGGANAFQRLKKNKQDMEDDEPMQTQFHAKEEFDVKDREKRQKMLIAARKNKNKTVDPFAMSKNSEDQKLQDSYEEEDGIFKERELDFDKAPDNDVDEATIHTNQQKEDVKDFFQSKRQMKAKAP